MTTNLTADDWLIDEAKTLGRHRTKKGSITEALQKHIQKREQADIFNIFNKIDFD